MSLLSQLQRQYNQPEQAKTPLPRKNQPRRPAPASPRQLQRQYRAPEQKKRVQPRPPSGPPPYKPQGLSQAQKVSLLSLLNAKPQKNLLSAHYALAHLSHVGGGIPSNFYKASGLAKQFPELKGKNPNDPNHLYSVSDAALSKIASVATRTAMPGPHLTKSGKSAEFLAAPKDTPGVTLDQAIPGPSVVSGHTGKARSVREDVRRFSTPKMSKATREDSIIAPALQVLAQTARPIHAIAGAADAVVTGKNPLKAAEQGAIENKPYTFSDVLKHVGVPKSAAAIGGFGLDVAADPTTYLSLGVGSVARKSVLHAADEVAREASTRVLAQHGIKDTAKVPQHVAARAEQAGQMARQHAIRAAGGAQERAAATFGGRKIPGVTPVTDVAKRGVKRAVRPVARGPVKSAAQTTKGMASDINPYIRPPGVSKQTALAVEGAARKSRAASTRAVSQGERVGKVLRKTLKPEEHQAVIDAVESNRIGKLTDPRLRDAAIALRSQARYALRTQRQAGVPVHELFTAGINVAKGYVPHIVAEKAAAGKHAGRTVKPSSVHGRVERRPLAAIRQEEPGKYIEDPASIASNMRMQAGASVGATNLLREVAKAGKALPGSRLPRPARPQALDLKPGEAVYHLASPGVSRAVTPREVVDSGEIAKALSGKGKAGQYFVADKHLVEQTIQRSSPAERSTIGQVYDKAQTGFKRLATATPGFHMRNLVGDTQMHYLQVPGQKMPTRFAQGSKLLREVGKQERAVGQIGKRKVKQSATTLKVTGEGSVPLTQLAKEFQESGAHQGGYMGRELTDLGVQGTKAQQATEGKALKIKGSVPIVSKTKEGIRRGMQTRENLPRAATWLHFRLQGKTPEEAAAMSSRTHIDYGNLTEFERRYARRLMPFYTFSARNIPIEAKALAQRPGKFANYEKLREEAVKATGIDPGYAANQQPYEQRQLGIPVKAGKDKFSTLSMSLPLVDLNELPGFLGPKEQAAEWAQRIAQLITPIVKSPVEFASNYSFTFRRPLEGEHTPLVAAPSWVQYLSKSQQKALGVVPDYLDKRSGKPTWGWPGKTDYIARQLPGSPAFIQNLMTSGGKADQTPGSKIGGFFTGVRATPYDAKTIARTKLNDAFTRLDQLNRQRNIFNQRGIKAANATADYRKLNAQIKKTQQDIYRLSGQSGKAVLPTTGAPPKPKRRSWGIGAGVVGGGGYRSVR